MAQIEIHIQAKHIEAAKAPYSGWPVNHALHEMGFPDTACNGKQVCFNWKTNPVWVDLPEDAQNGKLKFSLTVPFSTI